MKSRYVLAIEHDWRMRKLIRANLEALGLEVREAVSGQHGLQLLREDQPDLILVDVELPDMDALHLLGTLRTLVRGRRVSIIVLSADPPDRQWREEGLSADFLQKPFAALALLQLVRAALAGSTEGEGRRAER